tara:strand:+ start:74 stop:1069 length:996 start_codon:yes stop_codon:yes gene_type:complete
MIQNDTKKVPKSSKNFFCEKCNYTTCRKSQFVRHLSTVKHKNHENDTNDTKKVPKSSTGYQCECGKIYIQKQNLYRHRKICKFLENEINGCFEIDNLELEKDDASKELIVKLVEENADIKNMMYKQFETMQTQMHEQQKMMHNQISELIPRLGNNNTVTNKQKFNINIFLNEQCKDALTMEQFINKIQVTVDNLQLTKDKGLSEGVSNIFIENMKKLSLYERPMHCTDSKRETIYIKYQDNGLSNTSGSWFRDDENERLKQALNKVTHIQRKNIEKWVSEHPNWEENTKLQKEYMDLVKNCTEDINDNNNQSKIIRKVCNEINLNLNGDEE